jgi:hypothetical protein
MAGRVTTTVMRMQESATASDAADISSLLCLVASIRAPAGVCATTVAAPIAAMATPIEPASQ